mmetsp:Transcript_10500/g.32103  ORF Transcript_10500/g.32103 Transcript_10500/m.32103 type:complete len:238 (+) Transcript_10500:862-1575(+)
MSSTRTPLQTRWTGSTSLMARTTSTSTRARWAATPSGTHDCSTTAPGRSCVSCSPTCAGSWKRTTLTASASTASHPCCTSITALALASAATCESTLACTSTSTHASTSCWQTTSSTACTPSRVPPSARTSVECPRSVAPSPREAWDSTTAWAWPFLTSGSSCWRRSQTKTGTCETSCTRSQTAGGTSTRSSTPKVTTRPWSATKPLHSGSWTRRCTQTCQCISSRRPSSNVASRSTR